MNYFWQDWLLKIAHNTIEKGKEFKTDMFYMDYVSITNLRDYKFSWHVVILIKDGRIQLLFVQNRPWVFIIALFPFSFWCTLLSEVEQKCA